MVGGLPLTMSSANTNTLTHGRPAQPRAYSSCLWLLKAVLVDRALLLRKLGSCWLRLCLLEVAKGPALNYSGCYNPLGSRCSAKILGQSFVALSSWLLRIACRYPPLVLLQGWPVTSAHSFPLRDLAVFTWTSHYVGPTRAVATNRSFRKRLWHELHNTRTTFQQYHAAPSLSMANLS